MVSALALIAQTGRLLKHVITGVFALVAQLGQKLGGAP